MSLCTKKITSGKLVLTVMVDENFIYTKSYGPTDGYSH